MGGLQLCRRSSDDGTALAEEMDVTTKRAFSTADFKNLGFAWPKRLVRQEALAEKRSCDLKALSLSQRRVANEPKPHSASDLLLLLRDSCRSAHLSPAEATLSSRSTPYVENRTLTPARHGEIWSYAPNRIFLQMVQHLVVVTWVVMKCN
jgi:hypothetical protein